MSTPLPVAFDENAIGQSLALTVGDSTLQTTSNVDAHRCARSVGISNANGVQINQGGNGGVATTNDDMGARGESGQPGISNAAAIPTAMGGNGGSSIFGGSGVIGATTPSYGAGGVGASAINATSVGFAGGAGCWLVEEYS